MSASLRPMLALLGVLLASSVLSALLPPGPRDASPHAEQKPSAVAAIR